MGLFAIAAAAFFLTAVIEHAGAFTAGGWLDWQGLALLGLLCMSLPAAIAAARAAR